MQATHYRHNNHSVGSATVHLVWIPKHRKSVLMGDVRYRLIAILNSVAVENDWVIKALEVAPDHVHVLVEHDHARPLTQLSKLLKVGHQDC